MAKLAFGSALREALLEGIQDTAGVIVPNYGPSGRNTFVEPKLDIPMAMSSGKEILSDFSLEDPLKQLGCAILCESVKTMAEYTGDGISAAVLLCNEILRAGQKMLAAGANPIQLRKGIQFASEAACKAIWRAAQPADSFSKLAQIARNSAREEVVGDILVQALEKAGIEGVISIEDSQQRETTICWGGIQYDYGWFASEFANDSTGRVANLYEPYVLLMDKKIESIYEIQSVLEAVSREKKSLLIIAADIRPEVLRLILLNVKRNGLKVVVATAPGHGDSRHRHMEALAARLGALRIHEYNLFELENKGVAVCGKVEIAQVDKNHTQLSGLPQEDSEAILLQKQRIQQMFSQSTNLYDQENLRLTLAILAGQTVTIRVGGVSEVAMFEQKRLLEQALAAVQTAKDTGILPGGGKGFLLGLPEAQGRMAQLSGDEALGAQCVVQALCQPAKTIAENAGVSGSVVVEHLLSSNSLFWGFDARQKDYCDLAQRGILDSAGAVVGALNIAAETAATILTAEAAIYS